MDWDTRCGDCGAHFQLDPAGDVAGAACSECGGKRFFMNQPSPTQSDGTLRDMVDMDAGGVDRGGNPYGEGTITASMIGDEDACPICGSIDGCPHGTMRPHDPSTGVNNLALLKGTPGDPFNEGTIMGDDGERQRGFRDNYMHSKVAMTIYEEIAELARGLDPQTKLEIDRMVTHGESRAALEYLQQFAQPKQQDYPGLGWEGLTYSGVQAHFGTQTPSKKVEMQTLNMEPYPSLWEVEEPLMKQAGPLAAIPEALGLGGGAMGMLRGVGLANGISTLMNGVFGNGQQPATTQQPSQNIPAAAAPPINALGSADIPFLLVSDYDTPHSVKSVDEQHDDPEGQDQKEFNDGDKNPQNPHNPNNQDTGADGEDGVRDATPGYGFGENSPGIERATMLLPLLLHYFNSDESGESDPLIRAVHEALDKENPGYLDRPEEGGHEVVKLIVQQHGKSHTGGMNAYPSGLPATPMQGNGIQNPGGGTCPSCGGTLAGDGSCPQCGAKQNPQGGALPSAPTGTGMGTMPSGNTVGGPSYPPNRIGNSQGPVTPEQQQAMMDALQGMGKPELIPDMLQNPENWGWLLNQIQKQPNSPPLVDPSQQTPPAPQPGMMNPAGGMPTMDPSQMGGGGGQPMQPMANILSALVESETLPQDTQGWHNWHPDDELVSGRDICPQCHQPALSSLLGNCHNCGYQMKGEGTEGLWDHPEESDHALRHEEMGLNALTPHWGMVKEAPGKEHMKGVSPKRNRQYEHIKDSLLESGKSVEDAKEEAARTVNKQRAEHGETKEADANNLIPRCPKCGTATTSLEAGADNDPSTNRARCHNPGCGHIWELKTGRAIVALVDFANPTTLPAADQQSPHHDQGQDPGLTWKDKDGQPIQEGQTYELHAPGFDVPDEVKVISKKPDQLGLKLVGIMTNIATDPNTPDFTISPQDLNERQYWFEPSEEAQNLDNPNNQGNGGMPGMEQIPQSPQTTDEASSSYPNPATVSHVLASDEEPYDDLCHKCGGDWIDHTASSATTTMHECCRCGSTWETKDEYEGREASIDLSWIRNDGPDDDFFAGMERARAMQEYGVTSRNLSDIAARDERLQVVRDKLDYNKTAREQHMAGRHFTPSEQRALINERGKARNLEDLDLTGTHYTTRYDPTGKANEYNVPDEHLVLGL